MSETTSDWADGAEQQLLDQALRIVPHEGWTWRMTRAAGKACGFSEGETELLLPHGPADLAALLSRRHDSGVLALLADVDPQSLKVRERIAAATMARLDAACADEPATRRWMGYLTLPQNVGLGGRLAWESADALWRWAGDVTTDEKHYSKRAILAGVLTGALAVRMASGRAAAEAFVARRVDNVMAYEKWKAKGDFRPSDLLTSAAAALGRMRYRT